MLYAIPGYGMVFGCSLALGYFAMSILLETEAQAGQPATILWSGSGEYFWLSKPVGRMGVEGE